MLSGSMTFTCVECGKEFTALEKAVALIKEEEFGDDHTHRIDSETAETLKDINRRHRTSLM